VKSPWVHPTSSSLFCDPSPCFFYFADPDHELSPHFDFFFLFSFLFAQRFQVTTSATHLFDASLSLFSRGGLPIPPLTRRFSPWVTSFLFFFYISSYIPPLLLLRLVQLWFVLFRLFARPFFSHNDRLFGSVPAFSALSYSASCEILLWAPNPWCVIIGFFTYWALFPFGLAPRCLGISPLTSSVSFLFNEWNDLTRTSLAYPLVPPPRRCTPVLIFSCVFCIHLTWSSPSLFSVVSSFTLRLIFTTAFVPLSRHRGLIFLFSLSECDNHTWPTLQKQNFSTVTPLFVSLCFLTRSRTSFLLSPYWRSVCFFTMTDFLQSQNPLSSTPLTLDRFPTSGPLVPPPPPPLFR